MSKSEQNTNDWGDITSLWQAAPEPDALVLVKKIKAKTLRMKAVFVFELLSAIVGVLLGLYIMLVKGQFVGQIAGGLTIIICIGAGYFNWWVRKDIWKADSETLYGQLELMYKRANASVKYARVNLWGGGIAILLIILFYVLSVRGLIELPDEKRENMDLLIVIMLGYILILTIGLIYYLKKKKIEAKYYQKRLGEMSEDKDGDGLLT